MRRRARIAGWIGRRVRSGRTTASRRARDHDSASIKRRRAFIKNARRYITVLPSAAAPRLLRQLMLDEVDRARARRLSTDARLRRRILHTAERGVGAVFTLFDSQRLRALATLCSGGAVLRLVERCRTIAARESGGSDRGGNSDEQSGEQFGLHDGLQ